MTHSKGDAWIQLAERGMLVFFSLSVSSFNKHRIEQSLCLTLCKLQEAGKERYLLVRHTLACYREVAQRRLADHSGKRNDYRRYMACARWALSCLFFGSTMKKKMYIFKMHRTNSLFCECTVKQLASVSGHFQTLIWMLCI